MAAFIILLTLFSSAFATETCLDPTQGMRTIEGIAMLKGPLKGQCIATNEARPAELLVQDNNLLTINAVSHEAKFVVAQVDLTDIKDAVFQLEKFPPEWIAAHTQLRIRFKSPSVLLAKNEDDLKEGKLVTKISDLIISNEALGVKGFIYGLVPGALDNYIIVTRITSLQEKIRTMIQRDRHTVKQIELNLSVDEIKELVKETLLKAKTESYGVMYNTLRKNCATDIFHLIDQSLRSSIPQRNISNFHETLSFLPIIAPKILKDSGLMKGEITDLNQEIGQTSF